MLKQKIKGFTLVELIVVITILAILGTISFISLQGYSRDARDSQRISDIKNITKVLELYQLKNGNYPNPTDSVAMTYTGETIWNQGVFGETTRQDLGGNGQISEVPLDPLVGTKYIYSVLNTGVEYQVAGVLEGGITYSPSLVGQTYAGDETGYLKVLGNYNGRLAKVQKSGSTYILAIPTIINGDTNLTDIESVVGNNKLLRHGHKNLPLNFSGSTFNINGELNLNLVNSGSLVVYSGSLDSLTNSISLQVQTLENIQSAYVGTTTITEDNGLSLIGNQTINTGTPTETDKYLASNILKYSGSMEDIELVGTAPSSGGGSVGGGNGGGGNTYASLGEISGNFANLNAYNTKNGLYENHVNSIIKDNNGNMWFASNSSHSRFDGTNWTSWGTESLVPGGGSIKTLFSSSDGKIWSGQSYGVAYYDGGNWTTISYTNDGSAIRYNVDSITEDNNGNMWFGFNDSDGIQKYDGTNWTSYYFNGTTWLSFTGTTPPNSTRAHSLFTDSSGNIWVGLDGKISTFNGTTWTTYDSSDGVPNDWITGITQMGNGNIWLGSWNGKVAEFNGTTWTSSSLARVNHMFKGHGNTIWVSSAYGGAYMYDGTSWTNYTVASDGIMYNRLSSGFAGTNSDIWIGSYGYGISKFDGSTWTNYSQNDTNGLLVGQHITGITEDNDNNIWFGGYGGYLSKYNSVSDSWQNFTSPSGLAYVNDLFTDNNGNPFVVTRSGVFKFDGTNWLNITPSVSPLYNLSAGAAGNGNDIWVTHKGGGVFKYDGNSWINYTTADGLVNNSITDVTTDSNGNTWFTSNSGVSKFDGTTFINYDANDGIAYSPGSVLATEAIFEDSNGNIWAGGTYGVAKYDGTSWTTYNYSIAGYWINSIGETQNGDIILSSKNGTAGVRTFNGTDLTYYGTAEGMENASAYVIYSDNNDNIWVGTNAGVSRFIQP